MTKCHRIGEGTIIEVIYVCVRKYAFVCELWSWIEKAIGLNGKKRRSKINKKCGINEMERGGRGMCGSEI